MPLKNKLTGKKKRLSSKDLENYLQEINFDERAIKGDLSPRKGALSTKKYKKLLIENLEKYFQRMVAQGFIINLASAIWEEMPLPDDALWTAIDQLSDPKLAKKNHQQIDDIFQSTLILLQEDIKNSSKKAKNP